MSVSFAKPSSSSLSGFHKQRGGDGGGWAANNTGDGHVPRTLTNVGILQQQEGAPPSAKEKGKEKGKEKEVYFPTMSDVESAMDLSGENERLQACVKRERGSGTPMIVDGSTSRGMGKV